MTKDTRKGDRHTTRRIQIRLDPKDYDQLVALSEGLSVDQMARVAIKFYLDRA
jgi:hypothetical protein